MPGDCLKAWLKTTSSTKKSSRKKSEISLEVSQKTHGFNVSEPIPPGLTAQSSSMQTRQDIPWMLLSIILPPLKCLLLLSPFLTVIIEWMCSTSPVKSTKKLKLLPTAGKTTTLTPTLLSRLAPWRLITLLSQEKSTCSNLFKTLP